MALSVLRYAMIVLQRGMEDSRPALPILDDFDEMLREHQAAIKS